VAERVHERGGLVVAQLMHAGRVAHPDNKNGHETVAPSAIAAPGEIVTAAGPRPHPVPRALGASELPGVVDEFARAARAARAAELDGVELHAANGYLLQQFLSPATNRRTDGYGGSSAARARFVVEVVHAVSDAIGADRVGIKISPGAGVLGADEPDPAATYHALVGAIAPLGLAYLHITAGNTVRPLARDLRARFGGPVILNTGFDAVTDDATARRIVAAGEADLVAVGRPFLANPDLVDRWRHDVPLNHADQATFYGGDERGYTDYPTFQEAS
jgi:N-ethylmaleimide reductase